MREDEVLAVLAGLIRDIVGDPGLPIRAEDKETDIAGFDSGKKVLLILALEDRFGFHARSSEIDALRTVGDWAALVLRQRRDEPSGRSSSRRHRMIAFIGNCQAELLQRAAAVALPSSEFATFYQYFDVPVGQRAQAEAQLAQSDIVLVQDIQDLDEHALRDAIPSGARIVRFPFLRFASPWPYDDFNGLRDTAARRQDAPALQTTIYYDGVLGRLRRLVPDPEARVAAYKAQAAQNMVDPARVHDFECRRLEALDQRFETDIGRFILEQFRSVPLFHTVNRPNRVLLGMVLRDIFARLGIEAGLPGEAGLDALADIQVPVHPRVAERLSITWATERRLYRHGDVELTWEQYVRRYIARYG
jgi:acyl carrier protein